MKRDTSKASEFGQCIMACSLPGLFGTGFDPSSRVREARIEGFSVFTLVTRPKRSARGVREVVRFSSAGEQQMKSGFKDSEQQTDVFCLPAVA